jgi:NAD(P)-dependent dehydrogenase (short-subunit alcohol dehydrogenase family)
MDIAIVTGASSSLGLAISKRLIQLGFRVYGLGGDYTDCPLNNVNFKPMACDLADPDALEACCRQILEKEKGVYVLVHNAKYFGRNAFPEMDNQELERILRINLLCPLVLSRTLAESLMTLQGYIIQLGSPYAETTRGGPAGAAASGGLKWMGEVLFQDLRGYGVRVCHISPEPNRGRDPRTVVRPGARLEASIDPEAVAQAVEQILQSPFGNIVTEMIMRPLRVSEPEHDPVVRLPYPEPKPVPYTVPREMIEAEEQLEDEEIEKNQERRKRQRSRGKKRDDAVREEEPKPAREDSSKPAREDSPKPAAKPAGQPSKDNRQPDRGKSKDQARSGEHKRRDPQRDQKPDLQPEPQPEGDKSERSGRSRRRGRRKPKPPMTTVGFLDRKQADSPATRPNEEKPPAPANTPSGKSKADSPEEKSDPPKKAARKAAKKAVKKAARKAAKARPPKKEPADGAPSPERAPVKKAAVKKRPARKRAAKKAAPPSDSKSG